jgi:hypothetical protein
MLANFANALLSNVAGQVTGDGILPNVGRGHPLLIARQYDVTAFWRWLPRKLLLKIPLAMLYQFIFLR